LTAITAMYRSFGFFAAVTPFAAFALSPCPADVKCAPVPIEYLAVVYSTKVLSARACSKLEPANSKTYDRNLALYLKDNVDDVNRAKSYEGLDEMLQKATQAIDKAPLEKLREEFQMDCTALLKYADQKP